MMGSYLVTGSFNNVKLSKYSPVAKKLDIIGHSSEGYNGNKYYLFKQKILLEVLTFYIALLFLT